MQYISYYKKGLYFLQRGHLVCCVAMDVLATLIYNNTEYVDGISPTILLTTWMETTPPIQLFQKM